MSHATHRNEPCRTRMNVSCHTYEWVMPHTGMSHVARVWMSHVTQMNEACHKYEWVMRHNENIGFGGAWLIEGTHPHRLLQCHESCHTYEWVMPHIWMSLVPHMHEPCHTYERGMSYTHMRHVTRMHTPRHTCEWVMSHDEHTECCGTSLTGGIWMSHVTHVNEPMNESCRTCEWAYEWVMSHIWMSHVTHVNEPMKESCHTCEWASCESLIGATYRLLHYHESCHACQRDDILQKSPLMLRSLLIVATP